MIVKLIAKAMRLLLLPFLVTFLMDSSAQAQPVSQDVQAQLRAELLQMAKVDQQARNRWIALQQATAEETPATAAAGNAATSPELTQALEDLRQVDQRNTQRLREIITEHGWPGKSLVGEDGAAAAWLLAQHADADREFQQMCLTKMEACPAGEVDPTHLAYLTDRTLVAAGQPQRFGSQLGPDFKPINVADPATLDERRAKLGLPPMAEYIEQVRKAYVQSESSPPRQTLDELADMMTGEFSSEEQSRQDKEFFDVRLFMTRIWPERKDEIWLYVEQAMASALDKPYRQRVYRLILQDGKPVSQVFNLPGDPLAMAGAWKAPEKLAQLKPDDLAEKVGCAIYLTRQTDGSFRGETREKGCPSDLRGASYATSEVTVTADRLESWDRGFDAADKQVWGAVKGPYVFRKLKR